MPEPKSRRIPKPFWFGVAAVLMVVCGCSESESPLSDIATSKPDSDLVGTWQVVEVVGKVDGKLEDFYWHIGNAGDVAPSHGDSNFMNKESEKILYKNLMRVIGIKSNNKEKRIKKPTQPSIFFTTKIGKMRFANIPFFSKDNKIAFYSLVKYEVSDNQLTIWFCDNTEVIKKGELKGKESWLTFPTLTDSTENIVRYLEQGGDKTLFPDSNKLIVFQRVKPADRRD